MPRNKSRDFFQESGGDLEPRILQTNAKNQRRLIERYQTDIIYSLSQPVTVHTGDCTHQGLPFTSTYTAAGAALKSMM